MMYKLGKKPARPDAIHFKLADVLNTSALPPRPKTFGHQSLVKTWGMLGNDVAGDCVFAGGGHETILTNKAAGRTVAVSTKCAISDYSALTGYDPSQTDAQGNNPTDQGTDMALAADYRRKTGLIDSRGKRHLIKAYYDIHRANAEQILDAAYFLGAAGVGILFPEYAMAQFNSRQPWEVVQHQPAPNDGHYIPCVGFDGVYLLVVTWGRVQRMSIAFFLKYCDEAVAYTYPELIGTNGLTPEGFNVAQQDNLLSQVTKIAT